MDQTKSETEEMTYPFVCFSVDDHEEAWSDILVRDGEMVAVELVAVDSKNRLETVVWLGCVQYDGVRRVWETRTSQTVSQRLSQTNLLSIFGQTKVNITIATIWCFGDILNSSSTNMIIHKELVIVIHLTSGKYKKYFHDTMLFDRHRQ